MKKFLIGTTALVAAAAFAGAATARDVKVKVGGYMNAGAGVGGYINGAQAVDDFHIIRDGEIQFTAKGTLDNGITITARVEIEAFGDATDNGTDVVDENWVEIETAFGSLLLGSNDSAGYNVSVGFASTYALHGIGDTTRYYTPGSIDTFGNSDWRGVHYYTPNIAGFEAGISYHNDASSDGLDDSQGGQTDNGDDIVSAGLAYSNSFGDFDFAISGNYLYEDNDGGSTENSWGIGAEVGVAGFTLKGRYENEEFDAATDTEVDRFFGGVDYATGPWSFGVAAGYQTTDVEGGTETDEVQALVGASYQLGDGVSLQGNVQYGSVDVDGGDDEDAFGGALLLGVSF